MEKDLKEMEEIALKTKLQPSDETDASTDSTCIEVTSSDPSTRDKDHRILAIASIICGLSCIGIVALINSVKAETTRSVKGNTDKARNYSYRAKKFAVISILLWVLFLTLTPALLALVSYLLTLID